MNRSALEPAEPTAASLRSRLAGAGLLGLALPKLCCLLPVLMTSFPALLASLSLYGTGATLRSLDALCATALPAAFDLPLTTALAVFAAGAALLLAAMLRRA